METRSISFIGLLQIVFITLKLCNIIKWSWIWVLSPLWISFISSILIFIILFIVYSARLSKERDIK